MPPFIDFLCSIQDIRAFPVWDRLIWLTAWLSPPAVIGPWPSSCGICPEGCVHIAYVENCFIRMWCYLPGIRTHFPYPSGMFKARPSLVRCVECRTGTIVLLILNVVLTASKTLTVVLTPYGAAVAVRIPACHCKANQPGL